MPLRVMHLTTVDMSLALLLGAQIDAVIERGGEVIAVSADGPFVNALQARGVQHVALRSSTRSLNLRADLRTMLEFWRVVRRYRPTVLHTHNPKPGVYGRILGRLAGVPVVVNTVHGLYALPDDPLTKRVLVYTLEAVASRFSDEELVQSREDIDTMTRLHLARRSRLVHLGNGVDTDRFSPEPGDARAQELRTSWGIGRDELIVGAVGRLVAEKGYPELFEAVRTLPNIRLVVVGDHDPDKADSLPAALIDRARTDGVVFTGFCDEMPAAYRSFDILALASHREGLPRAAMEAAACGLPLVVTDIRGCREVVSDGENGILVPRRDPVALRSALARLAGDPALRRRLGDAARARALADFDEHKVVSRVLEAYRRAAERKGVTLIPDPSC